MKFTISKKIGIAITVTLLVTLNIMFFIILTNEESAKKDKTQKSVLELTNAVKEAVSFSMNEGVVDVSPMSTRLEQSKDIMELRILPTDIIEEGSESALDKDELRVLRSREASFYEEEFKDERIFRSIQPILAEESCLDCHDGNLNDPLAILSMRYSVEDDYAAIASQKIIAQLLLICAIVIAVGILIYIIKKVVVQNILRLTESAQKISEGDLKVNLEIESNDETRTLSDALTKMIDSFKKNDEDMNKQQDVIRQKAKEAEEREEYLNNCVNKMLDAMEKFSRGDLTVKLACEEDNETIRRLYLGFNEVVENMQTIAIQLNEAVKSTADASGQISSSSEEMAAGAQEQSMQASEVASAVEQMTRTILENSRNADAASKKARESGEQAKLGGDIVKETVLGMNQIAEVVNNAAEKVKELGKSTDQIGEIIQVIDDIADQTNLLALNAAIEAARAGEDGRGFAVVADEVRKLAERSAKATQEIADKIKLIQESTGGVITSIQSGSEQAKAGADSAVKAGDSLNKIIQSVHEVEDAITQVAAASEQQSTSSEQISRNIESISSVSQQTASGTEQIAHSAEDLNRLTEKLHEIVRKFKLDQDTKQYSKYAEISKSTIEENGRIVSDLYNNNGH